MDNPTLAMSHVRRTLKFLSQNGISGAEAFEVANSFWRLKTKKSLNDRRFLKWELVSGYVQEHWPEFVIYIRGYQLRVRFEVKGIPKYKP